MKELKVLIKKSDPRILALAGVTLIAVGFSLYMAVTAFTNNEAGPDYRRTPPAAFGLPSVDTIVDSARLNEPRLPDDVYSLIEQKTREITKRLASQKIGVNYLTEQGMPVSQARAFMASLKPYEMIYKGRDIQVEDNYIIRSVTSTSTETQQRVLFGEGPNHEPSGAFLITYSFVDDANGWRLDSIELTF